MAARSELNFISVCSGGGGLDLAVELACPSARPVLYVERESFAVACLVEAIEAGFLADAPVWSDARTIPGRRFRGCVDGIIGGIPCQPHSLAGKRLAHLDERDLWAPFRKTLVQSGAWWCLIENVGGMLSSGGAERVWRDLRRLGFAVEGGLFRASEIGAPHERERLFILGVSDRPGVGLADPSRARWEGRRSAGSRSWQCASSERGGEPLDQPGVGLADASRGGQYRGAERDERSVGPGQPASFGRDPERRDPVLVDAISGGHRGRSSGEERESLGRAAAERPGALGLFPPGPGDRNAWSRVAELAAELLPALPQSRFRGMADGLAPRLDRLRLLGNGVVPLEGALAFRTLATRLAERSSGAAELVRLMGEQQ